MVKHILVRAFSEVEHFHGEDIKAEVREGGNLYVYEEGSPENESLGVFRRWEYVRKVEE